MSIQNNFVENSTSLLINKSDELVINWHITEACNYSCTYCFAKWGKPNELHLSLESIEKLLDNLTEYFIKGSSSIKKKLCYKSVRLNISGGEPMMLGSTFLIVLILAKQKGFKTSIITNGHYLLNRKFYLPKNVLDMVGISFDNGGYDVRCQIGRVDRKDSSCSSDDLTLALNKLSSTQDGLKTKINTVVSKLNWQEDFSSLILAIKPDKWKVLQVGENNLLIFDMTESYLMIEPKGCFYQNSPGGSGYKYSDNINQVGTSIALKQISFNETVFAARYLPIKPIVFINVGVM